MKRAIFVRPAADRDLDEQAEYLAAHRDLEMALRFYRAAEETFQLLAVHPKIGKITQYQSPLLAGTRMFALKRFPNHLVFYLLRKNCVEVVRVLHGARDIEHLLQGQESEM